jgi:L-iditol 2-dehydrogenase
VLGHEVAGTIVESDVEAYPVGTNVAVAPGVPCLECRFCVVGKQNLCLNRKLMGADLPGGFAEQFAVSAAAVRAGCLVPVPSALPLEFAPVAEPLNAVLNGQDRARTGSWDSLFVLGLGPIGILHAAIAANRGASPVMAADPAHGRVESAATILGVEHVMTMDDGWTEKALERVDNRGWDVVVIATTAPQAFETAFRLVAPQGRILAFAGVAKDRAMVPIDANQLHYREIEIVGAFGATPRLYEAAVHWLSQGHIDLRGFVTSQVPLDQALTAFDQVEHAAGIKTLIRVA